MRGPGGTASPPAWLVVRRGHTRQQPTEKTVAREFKAVAVWSSLYKPSVPARVLSPKW